MKRYYYILFLSLIFTAYLFSQTEENEIVKIDTYINTDSVAVTKIDTTVVEVDYLKTTDDTLAIDDCKKTGVISARFGSLILINTGFVTWDIPISRKTTIVTKGFYGISGVDTGGIFSGIGLGLGYVGRYVTNDIIIKGNICASLMYVDKKINNHPVINLEIDIILWKVFSVGIELMGGSIPLPTIGLNIVY
jgi:hypothetical protein